MYNYIENIEVTRECAIVLFGPSKTTMTKKE